MQFQFLDNPEYWLSAIVILVFIKLFKFIFESVIDYIKGQVGIEEYKKEHDKDK